MSRPETQGMRVKVYLSGGLSFIGMVRHVPKTADDYWYIENKSPDHQSTQRYLIQNFDLMEILDD